MWIFLEFYVLLLFALCMHTTKFTLGDANKLSHLASPCFFQFCVSAGGRWWLKCGNFTPFDCKALITVRREIIAIETQTIVETEKLNFFFVVISFGSCVDDVVVEPVRLLETLETFDMRKRLKHRVSVVEILISLSQL
jgi:hypothetical protein